LRARPDLFDKDLYAFLRYDDTPSPFH
jgi:hypothetical protein